MARAGDLATLIFFRTIQEALSWAERLDVVCFYGGLEADENASILEELRSGKIKVMTCTSALAMGVDAASIGMAIHTCMPDSMINFVQESGRAGRGCGAAISVTYTGGYSNDAVLRDYADSTE